MSTWQVEVLRTAMVSVDVEVDSDDPGVAEQAVLDFLRGREVGDPLPEGAPRWMAQLREAWDEGYEDPPGTEWSPLFHEVRMYDDDGMDLVDPTEV